MKYLDEAQYESLSPVKKQVYDKIVRKRAYRDFKHDGILCVDAYTGRIFRTTYELLEAVNKRFNDSKEFWVLDPNYRTVNWSEYLGMEGES